MAKKLGEEAVETVIAAMQGDPDAVAAESADLLYHWLVLLAACGVPPDAVAAKLEMREGVSGLVEKAGRTSVGAAPPSTLPAPAAWTPFLRPSRKKEMTQAASPSNGRGSG